MLTAMILGMSINAIMAIIILITARQFPPIASQSMKFWSIGLFFLTFAYLVFISFNQNVPITLSIIGQLSVVIGIVCMSHAVGIFLKINQIKLHQFNLAFISSALLISGLVDLNMSATIFITCIGIIVAITVLAKPMTLDIIKKPTSAKLIIYIVSLAFEIVLIYRCFDYFADPRKAWDFNQISWADVLTIIIAVIGPVISTFGFMMMHQEKAYRALTKMASVDSLTKIYNRHAIEIKARALFKQTKQSNQSISVMLIDLDKFKSINDQYGHAAGDQVLIDTAQIIKKTIGPNDLVGRFGGEEFFVLLPKTTLSQAQNLAEVILQDIENYNHIYGSHTFKTTVSIGVAQRNINEDSFSTTLKRADLAMYDAKNNGRNQAIAV